jgi:AraC-like DNA-binding protein/quercetin dioxygenase-like cupin family protein
MKTAYSNLDIHFTIGSYHIQVLNLTFERFLRTIPNHSHGAHSYEIHYIPDGCGKAEIDGMYYQIKPGTLYVTGPHVEHFQTPSPEDPMCEYCVYLKITPEKNESRKPDLDSVAYHFQNYPFWFGQDSQNIHGLMQQLFFELEHKYLGYMEQVQSLLCQLIVRMVRNYQHLHLSGSKFSNPNLEDAKSLMVEEYFLYEYKDLSLTDLAQRLGISPRQTERFLKDTYGKTFLQKKTESRMSTASILLSDFTRSITSISEELGYSSIEHFSSAFRHYYGCSARKYREGMRGQ